MKSDVSIIIMTFFTGLIAGVFIYFTGFREIDYQPEENQPTPAFDIRVSTYGGCQMGGVCPSYRLESDGTLTYIIGGSGPRAGEVRTANLADGRLSAIEAALEDAALALQATEVEPNFCESWVDGIDTEYDIETQDQRYVLDTCGTAVDIDSELIELLDELMRDEVGAVY